MTRILIIGPTPPPFHGVAVAIRLLLDSALAEHFSLLHLDLADRRGIQHVNRPDTHDVWLFMKQWVALLRLLWQDHPRVSYLVLSQTSIGFIRDSFLLWPANLMGSRVVLHLHGGYFGEWYRQRSWPMQRYVRLVLRRATRVIVLGETFRNIFDGIIAGDRVSVVPNGIDCDSSRGAARSHLGDTCHTILHLSTLSHLKGALVLIKAIPHVLAHRQDVRFTLAGPWSHPEDRRWAERFINEHSLSPYVHFPGQVDKEAKQALLTSSHIFVFPGIQQEGQPLVALEAMAAGLPVIFTNRGSLRETVVDGEAGLEVPIDDPSALAAKILWLLDHPQAREAMGKRAFERARTQFTKTQHITRMIEVFAEAAAAR